MREYWTVAIYRRTEKGFGVAVFDSGIVMAKNDLDAVKQLIADTDAEEVLVNRY